MKSLQIQSVSAFDRAERTSAQVPNLSEKACLSVAIIAIVAFFATIGAMYVPGIVASGLTALLAVAVAPSLREKGGEA